MGQGAVIFDQLAFTLINMDDHRRLTIFVGGKLLGTADGDGGITMDHLLHQPTHGFQSQRERDHIEQQHILGRLVAGQDIGLQSSAHGHHFVGINRRQGCPG